MNKPQRLLDRLDAIGSSIRDFGGGLALLGLGSVGIERDRLDEYSDLDFFVIVQSGSKGRYLDDLSWLTTIAPTAFYFRNAIDGYKLLYTDDVYCEFAVFEPDEMNAIPFAAGKIIWHADEFDASIRAPSVQRGGGLEASIEFQLGEAITNLYVGLTRLHRGEALSAQRLIQYHAVDRTLHLIAMSDAAQSSPGTQRDPFSIERRIEGRHPEVMSLLPDFVQGYSRSRESALAILAYLDAHFTVNATIKERITQLADSNGP